MATLVLSATQVDRIFAKVGSTHDCWLWNAGLSTGGYGKIKISRRTLLAHRVMYELMVGAIPEGLQIDHLCRVRRCVNPTHLEPVTAKVNVLRGEALQAVNAVKTPLHSWARVYCRKYLYQAPNRGRTAL